jgi:hypothetical protein
MDRSYPASLLLLALQSRRRKPLKPGRLLFGIEYQADRCIELDRVWADQTMAGLTSS